VYLFILVRRVWVGFMLCHVVAVFIVVFVCMFVGLYWFGVQLLLLCYILLYYLFGFMVWVYWLYLWRCCEKYDN